MNERIEELWFEAVDSTFTDNSKAAHEKFAELIVLECEKVSKNPKWYSESPSDGWRNPIRHVCNTFKEHFGVEE